MKTSFITEIKMRNSILILLMITGTAFLHSCSSRVADDRKDKETQLAEYRKQMEEIRQEIVRLESELADDSQRGLVNVETSPVSTMKFEHYIDVLGRVQSDQNLLVSPESAGNIVEILVKEGQKVSKGQILARLNTSSLDRSIQEAEINLELATTLFERQELLWKQNIGSEVQYLQAKTNKESLERRLQSLKAQQSMSAITSPVNGVVDNLIQKQGEMASPATPFARIVNLDRVYITADVAETYLNKINNGDSIQISFPVLNTVRNATINRSSSVIDPDSRTFRIRVDMNNQDNQILPNLMAVLKLRTYKNPSAIVVPSILIKRDITGDFLFVADAQDGNVKARKRYIVRGLNDNNNTIVESGLNPGDKIITEGYAMVVDGAFLNVTNVN
jgi:membrane fusion protein, multidrug efflux system